ncbi:PREDICTED: prominin-1-like [Priapulus caudatus]|uniref:Prominin-1-like n=1 Tax=Priapulus caudatus TaxID=37621 RepID=A0ABM1EQF6_PRICU|nr:PREDICTED: prominin-1-like [Priapulus caudatus]
MQEWRLLPCFAVAALLLPVVAATSGNIALENGTVVWGDDDAFPRLPARYMADVEYKAGALAGLYGMTRGFVNIVQPNSLHTALREVLTQGDYQALVADPASKYFGIGITAALGIIFVIVVPVVGCVFGCCRCSGRCGGDQRQERDASRSFRMPAYSAALAAAAVMMLDTQLWVILPGYNTLQGYTTLGDPDSFCAPSKSHENTLQGLPKFSAHRMPERSQS